MKGTHHEKIPGIENLQFQWRTEKRNKRKDSPFCHFKAQLGHRSEESVLVMYLVTKISSLEFDSDGYIINILFILVRLKQV